MTLFNTIQPLAATRDVRPGTRSPMVLWGKSKMTAWICTVFNSTGIVNEFQIKHEINVNVKQHQVQALVVM